MKQTISKQKHDLRMKFDSFNSTNGLKKNKQKKKTLEIKQTRHNSERPIHLTLKT